MFSYLCARGFGSLRLRSVQVVQPLFRRGFDYAQPPSDSTLTPSNNIQTPTGVYSINGVKKIMRIQLRTVPTVLLHLLRNGYSFFHHNEIEPHYLFYVDTISLTSNKGKLYTNQKNKENEKG